MEKTPTLGDDPGSGGLDRRAVLRRGAILGGALVWTVPAVQTLAGPAFAAGTGCAAKLTLETKDAQGNTVVCATVTFQESDACCDCINGIINGGGNALTATILCTVSGACVPDSFGTC